MAAGDGACPENFGSSFAGEVAAAQDYDVPIVRRALPPAERARLQSEFFLVD